MFGRRPKNDGRKDILQRERGACETALKGKSLFEKQQSWYEIRSEGEPRAKLFGPRGDGEDFGFYSGCDGKPLEGFEQEATLSDEKEN